MFMEIFHCYQEEFNLKNCISTPTNIMTDEQREVECHSFFYSSKSSWGMQKKIIEISTCLLHLLSYGRVLCFLSFDNRKPNTDKLV